LHILPEAAVKIITILKDHGYQAYAVGGCVRDHLLSREVHDYDITTNATPEEVKIVFKHFRVIETGIQHGTVTVLYEGEPYEITTYRTESTYSDSRHPDSVTFSQNLSDDLCRRDFTVNAMAMSEDGAVVDLYGGVDDLRNRLIRCVGDPFERFSEDALRILRAIRFASVLDFDIEEHTKAAAFQLRDSLKKVSVERVAVEFNKLLCGKGVFRVLTQYIDIIGAVIPEAIAMKGFDQRNYHHCFDVLTHTARAVESIPPIKHLRLAAFFHDIGKPSTFSLSEEGVGHFYGHPSVSRDMADSIMLRLHYDNKTREAVLRLVKWHDQVIEPDERVIKRMLSRMDEATFFDLLQLKRADNLAQHPDYHARVVVLDEIESIAKDILAKQECLNLKHLAVKGGDLLAMGYPMGKQIGLILNALLAAVLNGALDNDRDALISYVKENF